MSAPLQGSLFDQADRPHLGPLAGLRRTVLGDGAWIDLLPGWLSGADELFAELADGVPWRAERRQMYDRTVDVPRLLHFYGAEDTLPSPVLHEARDALSSRYGDELGEPFTTAGLCYYRDGRDSVAWQATSRGAARTRTRWSRSSPSAPRGISSCGPAAAATRCGGRWATAT